MGKNCYGKAWIVGGLMVQLRAVGGDGGHLIEADGGRVCGRNGGHARHCEQRQGYR